MSHVVVQIRNLCKPRSYRFAEGASDGTFLEGSSASTIPFSLSQYKDRYFKYGAADRRGSEGTGSSLFEVNVHIWQFGRPQPRTMSVSERLAAAEARKKAAKAKTAETLVAAMTANAVGLFARGPLTTCTCFSKLQAAGGSHFQPAV